MKIFQNLLILFNFHHAINEYCTDYYVTGHCTSHSHLLRVERLLDHEMQILSLPNVLILLIDKPIQMEMVFVTKPNHIPWLPPNPNYSDSVGFYISNTKI